MNRSAALALLFAVALACSSSEEPQPPRTTVIAPPKPVDLQGRIPANPSPLAPGFVLSTPAVNGDVVTETESCAGCHADAAAQWRASAHAFGSFNNPAYRVVVDRFRKEVGKDKSRFCGACHDVAILVDGGMTDDIKPSDPRGHGGITCRVCHGIERVRPDGNGSYDLAASQVPIPRDGDAESLRLHKERMAMPPLKTPELCGSCHRSFLGEATGNVAHLVGMDEISSWQGSVYAGSNAARLDDPVETKECRDCHMPREDSKDDAATKNGKIASHRFLGAHTWMSVMRGDPDQLARAQAFLKGAASIDIGAAVHADGTRSVPADGATLTPGESLLLDVVVRNLRVGHRFPGGTLDAQDVWIELVVKDAATGKVIAEAGTEHEKTGDDPTAHRLRAVQADEHGQPLMTRETNKFRAVVFNHSIPPRDAELVRFKLEVPPAIAAPLKVTARLRHRSRNLPLFKLTCADAKTERGQAFAAEVKKRSGSRMDPCVPQPITDISTKEVLLGEGATPVSDWRRAYEHGLGMLHALQEQVDEARPSLAKALELAPTDREKAIVMSLYAQVATRQGRTDEVMSWLGKARAIVGNHPALAHIEGEALSAIWKWKEAAVPLRAAADQTPRDDMLWMHLAVAYGSAGDPENALMAAKHGLSLQPRDQDCLRVQSLALERLGAPDDEVKRAQQAFALFRSPDDAPKTRALCSKTVPSCALERIPVHVHPMRSAR